MKTNPIAASVQDAFKGGVTASEPTNTHVELQSQATPEPRANHGEKDGDGTMPEPGVFQSDRSRALKEIAERRNAQVAQDGEESVPLTDDAGNEVESNAEAPELEGADLDAGSQEQSPDAGATTVAAQSAPATSAPDELRTIIVDGQQVQVPLSKIVDMGTRTMQKEVAADLRLNQATQILEEAKRVASQPAAPAAAAEPAISDLNDEQLAELIQFGSKEQAAQAIKALRSTAPAFKPEDIVRAAQQAVAPQLAFEAGKSFAQKEYGDLLSDPDFGAIFLNKENALRKAGDQRSYEDLYKAIGDEMRVKFNRPKPGAPLPAAQPSTQGRSMTEKHAAKAQAPAAPRLASARLDGDGTQARPATRAEIIDKQRRSRGFQPYAAQK